jgi:hypothetical protein
MPGSHLFNLGLNQKKFLSTSKVTTTAITIGAIKGRGSTTRVLGYNSTKSTEYDFIQSFKIGKQ